MQSSSATTTWTYNYTRADYIASFCLSTTSSLLSIFGSTSILILVLKRQRFSSFYHRLIFGLSIYDLLMSCATLLQPITNRSDTGLLFAVGTIGTCEWTGFFSHFYLGSFLYSAILSVYFLLQLRYRKKEAEIAAIMEPWAHIVPFVIVLTFAATNLGLRLYNPDIIIGQCNVGPYPPDCIMPNVTCIRGEPFEAEIMGFFDLFFMFLTAVIGITCSWLIYWTVRQQLKTVERYAFTNTMDENQRQRQKAVATQAILYTTAFMTGFTSVLFQFVITYMAEANMEMTGHLPWNPATRAMAMISAFLFPLQGFLNFLIYTRHSVSRWKSRYPDRSWFWAYRQVLSGKEAPMGRDLTRMPTTPVVQEQSSPPKKMTSELGSAPNEFESTPEFE